MQELTKRLLKASLPYIAFIVTLFIGYLSLKEVSKSPIQMAHADKVYHTIAYFTLGLIWLISFPKSLKEKRLKYAIVSFCIIYGIVLEVLQGVLTAHRTASLLDVIANTVGVIVAMLLYKQVFKKIAAI